MNASDIMTCGQIWSCSSCEDARSAAQLMMKHNVGSIPIVDSDGCIEGIITDRDLCCRIIAMGRSAETLLSNIMSTSLIVAHADNSLEDVESMMRQNKVHRLPVVDDENKMVGYISLSDLSHHCFGTSEEHNVMGVLETIHS